jgi:hypothetical protein
LLASNRRSVHVVPLQQVSPNAAVQQAPWQQVLPAEEGQTLPQAPQLLVLVLRSTQEPLQRVWPVGQPHTPFVQLCPLGHKLPQAPQLVASVFRSVQVQQPHLVVPAGQSTVQRPPAHARPGRQA